MLYKIIDYPVLLERKRDLLFRVQKALKADNLKDFSQEDQDKLAERAFELKADILDLVTKHMWHKD